MNVLWEWIAVIECLQMWWDFTRAGFYLLSVFFHFLNIYLPFSPWQDPSRPTPEQASICRRAWFLSNTVTVLSFLQSMLFLPLHSIAVKREMTAGASCCFFPALFVFLQANGKLLLCPNNPVWNRINSQTVGSDQQVTSVAVYTLDHRYIDFHVFFFSFFLPLSFHPFFICLLFPLFFQPLSLSFWLFFFLCLLHSHATLFQGPLPRWFISFLLSDVLNNTASKATSAASPQEQHRRARYICVGVCVCVLPSLILRQD